MKICVPQNMGNLTGWAAYSGLRESFNLLKNMGKKEIWKNRKKEERTETNKPADTQISNKQSGKKYDYNLLWKKFWVKVSVKYI